LDHTLLIKVSRKDITDREDYQERQGVRPFARGKNHGLERCGPEFQGDMLVAVCANLYAFSLVTQVLTQCRVPYSVSTGKPIKRKQKKEEKAQVEALDMGDEGPFIDEETGEIIERKKAE